MRGLAKEPAGACALVEQLGRKHLTDVQAKIDEMKKVVEVRRILTSLPVGEAVETLMKGLAKTSSNAEFLLRVSDYP